ncbi:MAG: hypothetical protein AAGE01_04580 [Pseudomonadota bacterium]
MLIGLRRFITRRGLGGLLGKLFIGSIIVAVTAVFGAKWHIESKTRQLLDDAAAQVSLFGTLSYGKVTASLGGAIKVTNFSFRPSSQMGGDISPVIADLIAVDFGSFIDMVRAGQDVPRTMDISIEGVLVDFGSAGQMVSGNPAEALACGDIQRFEVVDLVDMGFPNPRTDMRLSYEIFPSAEKFSMRTEISTAGAASTAITADLMVPGLYQALRSKNPLGIGSTRAERITITSDAARFNQARNRLCAGKLASTEEEAVEANVEAFVAMVATLGWMPDAGAIDQYRSFVRGDGTWKFVAAPEIAVDLATLDRVDDVNWLAERFDLRAAVGAGEPQRVTFEKLGRVIVGADGTVRPVDDTVSVAQWVDVPLADIGGYVGRDLTLATRSGKRYIGRIIDVNASEVVIRAQLPGGVATVPLALTQIRAARSYEIVRTNAQQQE